MNTAGHTMFEKVLIPTDLSEMSEKLVACADRIRNVREVVLLHIVRAGGATAREREDAERQLGLVKNQGTATRCLIREDSGGDIPAEILKTAGAERPSLIIMGARSGLLSKTLLGHGGTEVLTRSQTHVLVMRFPVRGLFSAHPQTTDAALFDRILFPLDFSRPANIALESVGKIGEVTEIILLHVIRKIEAEEQMNFVVREVEKQLSDAREKIKADHPEIRVKMMVRFGDPTSQIAAVADEEEVTLVMMSRFGRMDYIRKIPLGTTTSKVTAQITKPVLVMYTDILLEIHTRELAPAEFYLAEKIWFDYHQTKSDHEHDRIFAVFIEDTPVSVARCKRHDDGYEVDGIFTWEEFRGNGYSRMALDLMIRECGNTVLYMYAVRHLVNFYASFGFVPIPEEELPLTIRERYSWAMGEMAGAGVCPMKRELAGGNTTTG
ncbi:GNAT family N-acetyltransferase [uncultured Methanoregula sp.]|uniref:GNAT family N-acetyltransferase n=1 Tax=uncultured Methanoregula sp. TaxID=1005933 RepID=UPI00374794A8